MRYGCRTAKLTSNQAMIADADLQVVPVCREGESFAIALGLIIGGKTPAVLIQDTGLSTWLIRRRQCQAAKKALTLRRPSRSRSTSGTSSLQSTLESGLSAIEDCG